MSYRPYVGHWCMDVHWRTAIDGSDLAGQTDCHKRCLQSKIAAGWVLSLFGIHAHFSRRSVKIMIAPITVVQKDEKATDEKSNLSCGVSQWKTAIQRSNNDYLQRFSQQTKATFSPNKHDITRIQVNDTILLDESLISNGHLDQSNQHNQTETQNNESKNVGPMVTSARGYPSSRNLDLAWACFGKEQCRQPSPVKGRTTRLSSRYNMTLPVFDWIMLPISR